MTVAVVQEGLRTAGAPLGPPAPAPPELHWGSLFAELDGGWDDDYVLAVELIYEGYLAHYRESRVVVFAPGAREAELLAGDVLYARGLRLIAARGDAPAVGLLARLMAACSYLRSLGAPFAADDALWATAMGGLAALRGGVEPRVAAWVFNELDDTLARGAVADVAALARVAAEHLGLRHAAPLLVRLHAMPAAPVPAAPSISGG